MSAGVPPSTGCAAALGVVPSSDGENNSGIAAVRFTGCAQRIRKTCSFPQVFPPFGFPPNCYSDLKAMQSWHHNHQNQTA